MRNFVLLVTAVLIAMFAGPPAISVASATTTGPQVAQSPKLYVTVGVAQSGATLFLPATIIIPQVNITLNITFVNNYTVGGGTVHTFSIDNTDAVREINTGNVTPGKNASIEFHINTLTNITFNGTSFTPESSGQGIRWYCVPHRAAVPPMVAEILLAGVAAPTPEKGILIRAYWIGIIGIAATLVWLIVSYFIIKSSSRHFTDHHEHVRKGLP